MVSRTWAARGGGDGEPHVGCKVVVVVVSRMVSRMVSRTWAAKGGGDGELHVGCAGWLLCSLLLVPSVHVCAAGHTRVPLQAWARWASCPHCPRIRSTLSLLILPCTSASSGQGEAQQPQPCPPWVKLTWSMHAMIQVLLWCYSCYACPDIERLILSQ